MDDRKKVASPYTEIRVLVTGVTGLLGVALQRPASLNISGFAPCTAGRTLSPSMLFKTLPVELTDPSGIQDVFKYVKPDLVIHTMAIESVDFAETNREVAYAVNVKGTQLVADLCCEFNSRIIYISSNAIFDGRTLLYLETSMVNPINHYGELKIKADQIIQESALNWAIVRSIMMCGWSYPGQGIHHSIPKKLRPSLG